MELQIEESLLDDFIAHSNASGDGNHRGIYNFLLQIKMLGYLHNDIHKIILTHKEHSADISEKYAKYLDKRASGLDVKFNP